MSSSIEATLKYYSDLDSFVEISIVGTIQEALYQSVRNQYSLSEEEVDRLSEKIFKSIIKPFDILDTFKLEYYDDISRMIDKFTLDNGNLHTWENFEPKIPEHYLVDADRTSLYDRVLDKVFPTALVDIDNKVRDISYQNIWYDSDDGFEMAKFDVLPQLEQWVTLVMCLEISGIDYMTTFIAANCIFYSKFQGYLSFKKDIYNPIIEW